MWPHVFTWSHVVSLWSPVASCGNMQSPDVSCGLIWSYVVSYGLLRILDLSFSAGNVLIRTVFSVLLKSIASGLFAQTPSVLVAQGLQ